MPEQERMLTTEVKLVPADYKHLSGDTDMFTQSWRETHVTLTVACDFNPADGGFIKLTVTSTHQEGAGDRTTFKGKKVKRVPITLNPGETFLRFKDDKKYFRYFAAHKGKIHHWDPLKLSGKDMVYGGEVHFDHPGWQDHESQGAVAQIAVAYVVLVP